VPVHIDRDFDAGVSHLVFDVDQRFSILKKFDAIKQRRYCGLPCRMKANYARHAEAYRAYRREKYQTEKKTAGKK
jgi:hypothetical protein